MSVLFSSLNEQVINAIDISDRGLAYGDGHFTTAKITNGKIEHLEFHLARLKHAHDVLGLNNIDQTSFNVDTLRAYLCEIASNYQDNVIKVVVTAGAGGRGYSRKGLVEINRLVTISEYPQHYYQWQEQGITLGMGRFELANQPVLAGIKHLNRLEQVLIRAELDKRDVQDIIVCDTQGFIIEASCANVFWFKQGQWYTPQLNLSGVNGVLRQYILSQVDGIDINQFKREALDDVEAIFLCNSIMGIVPVCKFMDKALSVHPVKQLQKYV